MSQQETLNACQKKLVWLTLGSQVGLPVLASHVPHLHVPCCLKLQAHC